VRRKDTYLDAGAAELAVISGRPVLIAPAHAAPLSARRIVLAWKDTREARRAAADAMPFLEGADAVLVLEICFSEDAVAAGLRTADMAAGLARHGVAAEGKATVGCLSAGEEIILEAEAFGADLVISGAYGHSRLGEWAFGGVTSELLRQDDRHVLLSH
jgi:nucleotide-binding universal stress UspA family protein